MQPQQLRSADGVAIAARFFAPADGTPLRSAVLIGGAMGVRQGYYEPFARWLATQGHLVATFDYRGMGESRQGSLRGFRADLFDWARDTDTVIEALAARAGGRPLVLIGHSLGAQLPGLLAQRHRLSGLICVAAGSGHWRFNPAPLRLAMPAFWHALVPLLTALFGYFPGRRLRLVDDLPRGVALQWRRWCLHPQYHLGVEGVALREAFASLRIPVTALSIDDDTMMSAQGTRALLAWYAGSRCSHEHVRPAPGERIGHLGFFRRRFAATHWLRITRALDAFDRR